MKKLPTVFVTFLLTLAVLGLITSCNGVDAADHQQSGSLHLSCVVPTRTVVIDPSSAITSYKLAFTRTSDDLLVEYTLESGTSWSNDEFPTGVWNIAVTAYADTTEVGSGSLSSITMEPAGVLNLTVPVSLYRKSTGNYQLSISFPETTGIDYVSGQLCELDGTLVGSLLEPEISKIDGTCSAVLTSEESISSGTYYLLMTFRRGGSTGTIAGIFGESVNIWDNLVSDHWIGTDGTFLDSRSFAETEFNSSNASLSNLVLSADGSDLVLEGGFSSLTTTYTTTTAAESFSAIPTGSIAGQYMTCRVQGSTWVPVASTSSCGTLPLFMGPNVFEVKVQAPDLSTTKTYKVTVIRTGTAGFNMVDVASGTLGSWTAPVQLSPFKIAATEVQQYQYYWVTGSAPSSNLTYSTEPVEQVSWYDAVEFCNRLSVAEGFDPVYAITDRSPEYGYPIVSATVIPDWTKNGYRLPTNAEWEFAARGGNLSQGYTYAGSNTRTDVCWSADLVSVTQVVAQKTANELGLFDMSGNVREWCWDWSGDRGSSAQVDPLGVSSGTEKILCGGSIEYYYDYYWNRLKVDSYITNSPSSWDRYSGFRVVRGPHSALSSVTDPVVITISFSGQSSVVFTGNTMTVTATASSAVDAYAWYIDGVLQSSETTNSIVVGSGLAYGPHSLMCRVRSGSEYFSKTLYFAIR